jgi:hypothetical protein
MCNLAYPVYECEDCIGMKEYGCYCSHYEAVAPCKPPERWRLLLRYFLEKYKGVLYLNREMEKIS